MSAELAHHAVAVLLRVRLDRGADIAEPCARLRCGLISASCVASTSFFAFSGGSPAKYIRLVSPCQPSSSGVTSILTMSPSFSVFSLGMPWQITWLIEMQQLCV